MKFETRCKQVKFSANAADDLKRGARRERGESCAALTTEILELEELEDWVRDRKVTIERLGGRLGAQVAGLMEAIPA